MENLCVNLSIAKDNALTIVVEVDILDDNYRGVRGRPVVKEAAITEFVHLHPIVGRKYSQMIPWIVCQSIVVQGY